MLSMKYKGYAFAIATSLMYSLWYLLSGSLVSRSPYISPLFPWLLIEATSAAIVFVIAKGDVRVERLSDLKYPVVSSFLYSVGNYVFYVLIATNGVPAASAFSAAEIIIFTLLLWLTARRKINIATYSLASAVIAGGLVIESLAIQKGAYVLNTQTIVFGIIIAAFYGAATYFYYLSAKHIKSKFTTMFFIQAPQVVVYGMALLFFTHESFIPLITGEYLLIAVIVGVVLLASFYLETTMMKVLSLVGRGSVATGYILSDLQLIPVVINFLIVSPGTWQTYVPGLLLVTVGLAMLDWE